MACEEITLLHQRISELEERKYFVNCRFELGQKQSTDAGQPDGVARPTDARSSMQLQTTEQSLVRRIDEVRIDQASLYERTVDGDNQSAALRPWLDLQSQHLAHLAETCGIEPAPGPLDRPCARAIAGHNWSRSCTTQARANPWATFSGWVASAGPTN